jgi:hypothetical protein
VVSKLTCVHVPEFELLLKIDASVAPDVLRSCASCQSNVQPEPEQVESVVPGRYQKVRVEVPGGTVKVWVSVLSPDGSVPESTPSKADELPLWALAVVADGAAMPPGVQPVRPDSKPPL